MTLGILLGGIFAALAIRLGALQLAPDAGDLARLARQTTRPDLRCGRTLVEQPSRGAILDRQGRVLAKGWYEHAMIVDPAEALAHAGTSMELAVPHVVACLAAALEVAGVAADREDLEDRLRAAASAGPEGRPARWLQVARGLDPRQRRLLEDALREAGIGGVSFEHRLRRTYPYGAVTSQVVGVVGEDPDDAAGRVAGRTGIEWQLDRVLDGAGGSFLAEMDARGRELLPELRFEREVRPGSDVMLTLDAEIQRICLETLASESPATGARSASAVVLSARTGEVLAACTWPSVDPHELASGTAADLRLAAFLDLYEPGSTIKPVFYAWALEQGIATLDTSFDCGGPKGYEAFGPRLVREYSVNPAPLRFGQALIRSSNVAAVRLGYERLGLARMYDALEAFHVAGRPGLVYPAVARCRYTPREEAKELWTGTSFPQGYELMISPLGLARMFLPFANEGLLVEPSLLLEVRSEEHVLRPDPRADGRTVRAISAGVASAMVDLLERVVDEGTGKPARSARFSIAAKTGTPRIQRSGLYNPVICAFAPVRPAPEIVVVVQHHDVPNRGPRTYTGGAVSGPPAKTIIERTLAYLGVPEEPGRSGGSDDR